MSNCAGKISHITSEDTMMQSYNDDRNKSIGRPRRRIQQIADSDSDENCDELAAPDDQLPIPLDIDPTINVTYNSENEENSHPSHTNNILSGSDETSVFSNNKMSMEDPSQLTRIKAKKNKLRNKFSTLLSSRRKDIESNDTNTIGIKALDNDLTSDEEMPEIAKLKQKIKESEIYNDLDNSDEENDISQIKKRFHGKSNPKGRSSKLIPAQSSKNVPISAKQALENMQKIKSESNRMLREKEVSLPYHCPKALSLKDIMSRSKPAISANGKALPLKMNHEQLKQYALLLEQRQKEIIELCKSDSDEDQLTDINKDESEDNCSNLDKITNDKNDNTQSENISSEISNTEQINVNIPIASNANEMENRSLLQESINLLHPINDSKISDIENNALLNQSVGIVDVNECQIDLLKNGTEFTTENNDQNGIDSVDMYEDIDLMIENADIDQSNITINASSLSAKPTLAGAPGMLIDFDSNESIPTKKLTGVELLKERFIYFANLKTPDELERTKERRIKPGTQHLKLKQEFQDKIAEETFIEWSKRLDEQKQNLLELKAIRGDGSDDEDELEKIEAKLAEEVGIDDKNGNNADNESDGEEEEEEIEDDIEMKETKRKRNPLIADEAEESDGDDNDIMDCDAFPGTEIEEEVGNNGDNTHDEGSTSEDDETSDDSDIEQRNSNPEKRGRILKAFEDSDDEDFRENGEKANENNNLDKSNVQETVHVNSIGDVSIDDELQSGQLHHSHSEDIFASQESAQKEIVAVLDNNLDNNTYGNVMQSFTKKVDDNKIQLENKSDVISDKLSVICETQPYDEANFDDIAGMCSGSFSQNLVSSQTMIPQTTESNSDSQTIGDDVLALCTGNFYDNKFVDKEEAKQEVESSIKLGNKEASKENTLLQTLLLELDDPEFDEPKPNKYFCGDCELKEKKENKLDSLTNPLKKKFVIDSDDETMMNNDIKRRKKFKKNREKRALLISDDEEEDMDEEEMDEDLISNIDDDDVDRSIEYDSEENEVEVKPRKVKHKIGDFLEQEAELTSEDEWIGSGDEDEAGLDRMEREAGDDDTFHQGRLQRELGEIHMREVLDQDKREVRMIQELLFEDGDLGDGHRQRKFRWKNANGDEELGTIPEELADTQEEDFESEEQWRKERHERETFLRQLMKKDGEEDSPSVSINRTTIIKANLNSKTMSSLLLEVNTSKIEKTTTQTEIEKKTNKDIPSPVKKPFPIQQHQQQYRGSLLSRGHSALARLAALAAPLAVTEDHQPTNTASLAHNTRRNFLFTSISPAHTDRAKVTKRKAPAKDGTPHLIKRLKSEENVKRQPRRSLLDHMKT